MVNIMLIYNTVSLNRPIEKYVAKFQTCILGNGHYSQIKFVKGK